MGKIDRLISIVIGTGNYVIGQPFVAYGDERTTTFNQMTQPQARLPSCLCAQVKDMVCQSPKIAWNRIS